MPSYNSSACASLSSSTDVNALTRPIVRELRPESDAWTAVQEDIDILTAGKYIALNILGQGYDGQVFLCISTVNPAIFHAVKVPSSKTEVHILQRIAHSLLQSSNVVASPLASRFPRLIDYGQNWHATSIVQGPTLKALLEYLLDQYPSEADAYAQLPKTLVLHIALELVRIFKFLHEMDPAVMQHDFSVGNIMLEYPDGLVVGYPNVVLVDFAIAREHPHGMQHVRPTTRELALERAKVYNLMKMMGQDGSSDDKLWALFQDAMEEARWEDARERSDKFLRFEEFLQAFESGIEERKAAVSRLEMGDIEMLMGWVMGYM